MLHEVLLALLGFPGDVIQRSAEDDCFQVSRSKKKEVAGNGEGREAALVLDMLTEAEQEQINRIVQLGWLYDFLNQFVRRHQHHFGIKCGAAGGEAEFEVYKAALALGLGDLLEEYVADVADIETKLLSEGPIPLSSLHQRLQAYLLVMPAMHSLLAELEQRRYRGTQILDFLATYQSGIPVVNKVIQRMLLRVRIVFLKQTLGWMLHGVLADPAREYFIVEKHSPGMRSTMDDDAGASSFDWTGSYSLRLESVPEHHISPRAASKIMFAGKATRLLHLAVNDKPSSSSRGSGMTGFAAHESNPEGNHFLNYFGGLSLSTEKPSLSNSHKGKDERKRNTTMYLSSLRRHTVKSSTEQNSPWDSFDSDGFLAEVLQDYCTSNGFSSLDEFYGFAAQFQEILLKPDLAYELLERLIDDVHDLVSIQLWEVIRDKYECYRYFHLMRNTFLHGKGEFFQSMLDELLMLVKNPLPSDSHLSNKLLQHTILRRVGRRLNLDFDGEAALGIDLQVISENATINGNDFATLEQAGDVIFKGSVVVKSDEDGKRNDGNRNAKGKSFVGIDLAGNRALLRQVLRLGGSTIVSSAVLRAAHWSRKITNPAVGSDDDSDALNINNMEPSTSIACEYNLGYVGLSEERYLTKGFHLSTTFSSAWNSVSSIGPSHSLFQHSMTSSPDIQLGAMSCILYVGSARKGIEWENSTLSGVGKGSSAVRQAHGNKTPSSRTYLMQNDLASCGVYVPNALSIGVSIYARLAGDPGSRRVEYYARLYVCGQSQNMDVNTSRFSSDAASKIAAGVQILKVSQDDIQLYLCSPEEWRTSPYRDVTRRALCAASSLVLEVEYSREVVPSSNNATSGGATKGVIYKLRARLRDKGVRSAASNLWDIDMPLTLENHVRVRAGKCCVGVVGSGLALSQLPTAGGLSEIPVPPPLGSTESDVVEASSFYFDVSSLEFRCHGSGSTQSPAASPYLSSRYPLVYAKLDSILTRYKYWANLKMSFGDSIPSVFSALFDSESLKSYGSVFTFLMKVRLVLYSLERLYLERRQIVHSGFRPTKSSRRQSRGVADRRAAESENERRDRLLSHLRHCMLFFLSNLFYYLQVDVIDAEYVNLCNDIDSTQHNEDMISSTGDIRHDSEDASHRHNEVHDKTPPHNFKSVLQAHKNYLATVIRLSMVDNVVVQDAIDRVLHACMRVAAIYHLLMEDEVEGKSPSVLEKGLLSTGFDRNGMDNANDSAIIPIQEVEALKKEFFSQMSYLLQIIRKVENRGFIFRIDFNGFMSEMSSDIDRMK